MPNHEYAYWRKSHKFWPLYEVILFENWNESESIKSKGHQRIIRLFYTKQAACLFAYDINKSLGEIKDVPDETR